jgi:hypothetical protein
MRGRNDGNIRGASMKQIVPWRDDRDRDEPRMSSLMFGVPSLAIGLGGIILILSCLSGKPVGSQAFYDLAIVPGEVRDARGTPFKARPAEYIVPSVGLLLALCLGAFWGGFGLYLSREEERNLPARTSAAGLILCSTALTLSCLLYAWAYV